MSPRASSWWFQGSRRWLQRNKVLRSLACYWSARKPNGEGHEAQGPKGTEHVEPLACDERDWMEIICIERSYLEWIPWWYGRLRLHCMNCIFLTKIICGLKVYRIWHKLMRFDEAKVVPSLQNFTLFISFHWKVYGKNSPWDLLWKMSRSIQRAEVWTVSPMAVVVTRLRLLRSCVDVVAGASIIAKGGHTQSLLP